MKVLQELTAESKTAKASTQENTQQAVAAS